MVTEKAEGKGFTRRLLRKVSSISGLLRSTSKKLSESSFSDRVSSKNSATGSVHTAGVHSIPEGTQHDQIPALHSKQQTAASTSDVQLFEDGSLQVAPSEWSQTKSARRRQRRKDHHSKQPPADVADPSAASADELSDAASPSRQSSDNSRQPEGTIGVNKAAVAASKLLSLPRGKRTGSRPFSPLGRKKFGSRNRRDGAAGQLSPEDLQLQQQTQQEDAELQIRAKDAVTRAHAANAAFCQVERSHKSGSPAAGSFSAFSPRKHLELDAISRTASESKLGSQLSSATSLARVDSAELTQLTDPEVVHKVVKKIKGMYGSCSTGDSNDVVHMLGSIQASLKAYAAAERLWLADQPGRVKHTYLCNCFPGTDAKMINTALTATKGSVDQAIVVLERKGLLYVPSAFTLKDLFQLLEEPGVYQVIPFMTHLELNHIKDDKTDSEKAHKGQEAVKLIHAGLQPEYRHRFKLQPEFGEPVNSKDFLPPLTSDRDSHIGDDLILQCAAYWDNRAQQLSKHMVFLTNDIALSNRALALGIHTDQATHWLKQVF